jgi:methylated-DNA-[protein]-cysteine S-methyltransferase
MEEETPINEQNVNIPVPPLINQCVTELAEYFAGNLKIFEVSVQQEGTVFQQLVWSELLGIDYGKTISYLQLAKRLGNAKVIRAAASTNGKNKIAIIVPCHRVIGAQRNLVGYAGGLHRKRWLLEHETRFTYGTQTLF